MVLWIFTFEFVDLDVGMVDLDVVMVDLAAGMVDLDVGMVDLDVDLADSDMMVNLDFDFGCGCSLIDMYVKISPVPFLLSHLAANAKRCTRCMSRMYCSKACQRRDWPTHKLVCAPPTNVGNSGYNSFFFHFQRCSHLLSPETPFFYDFLVPIPLTLVKRVPSYYR
jgi:hypothetical protein